MRRAYLTIIALTVLALMAGEGLAELRLGSVFTDAMVLQRGVPVSVYGSDTPGQVVEVDFAGRTAAGVTDGAGIWRVVLEPMAASSAGRTLSVRGSTSVSLSDVLVGEVWLAAGQSNMNWPLSSCASPANPDNFNLIRMCNWEGSVATGPSHVYGAEDYAKLVPEQFYVGSWQQMDAGTVAPQSGIAYFFADALAQALKGRAADGGDVPIGIIDISYGGTTTEAFIQPEHLRGEYLEQAYADPRGVRTLGGWAAGRITQNLQGYSHTGGDPLPHPYAPGFLYWTGVDKLKDFALRGVIWYQGESNADFAEAPRRWSGERVQEYQTLVMRTLVDSWRSAFDREDLPFLMVQLPRIDDPSRTKWPWYRAAQDAVARSRAGVELAVAPEYGADGSNVHPPDKQPVGERLALLARQQIYGERALAARAPSYKRHRVEQGSLVVEFDNADGGLLTADGAMPRHFELAGADRVFHSATAFISGATVELHSPAVPSPVAARYAWDMNIDPNLVNAAGLPAAPFRTDDWIVAPATARRIRVACIGDSITYGYGLADRASESYPARLQEMLGGEFFDVRNFGHSGAGFVYKAYIGQPEHAAALAFEPDIVICNLGINDISNWGTYGREDFILAARELFDAYASLPSDPLIVQWHRLGPLFPGQKFYGDPNVETLNDWLSAAAAVVGADTIDMYRDFKGHPEWYPDNLHPNAAGAERIAKVTYDYLRAHDTPERAASACARRHWRVFVLTGQSNSLGTTADPSEADISPGIESADGNIAFFWSNRDTSGDASAAGLIGDSEGHIRELQAQQGSGSNPLFWGPEIQFARTLYASGLRDFLVVKASRGGGGNSWWYKDAADPQMYEHVVDTVNEALGQLPEDDTFEIAGLLYLQGESDSAEEAVVAGERLEYLIDNLRADLPNAEAMRAVIGGIAAATANDDAVRAQQQALAASDPTIDYFSNLDLQPNLYDGLHFDKQAKLIVGQRYAQAFLDSGALSAPPLISEFCAENRRGLQDEDGDYSDWVELHNPGPAAIDLAGWSLTDDPFQLSKWSFPAGTVLPEGGYLLVFASGKDRGDPAGELHAGFQLARQGYLALVARDGSISQSFEYYPDQYPDRSYGLAPAARLDLIDAATAFKAAVPLGDAIGVEWNRPGYDDSDSAVWKSGANGAGYERAQIFEQRDSADFEYRYEMDVNPATQDLDGNGTPDWFAGEAGGAIIPQSYSGGVAVSQQSASVPAVLFRTDFTASLARNLLDGADSPWTIELRVAKDSDSAQGADGWFAAALQNPGADFAACVRFFDGKVRYWDSSDHMVGTDLSTGFHSLRIAYAGGNSYFVWVDGTLLNSDSSTGFTGDNGSFNSGGAWFIGDYSGGIAGDWELDYIRFAAGAYSPQGFSAPGEQIYAGLYGLDLGESMAGQSAGMYMRIPFQLTVDPDDIDSLWLEMRYDDGFIAYLNGVEICRRNASGASGWEAAASRDRPDGFGRYAEKIDIGASAALLRAGDNVLAVHGLNRTPSASRFLVQPRLCGRIAGGAAYQDTASPGSENLQSLSGVQAWRSSHFTPAEIADPLLSGDASDPDGDGLANLLEYGFGTDPRLANAAPPFAVRLEWQSSGGLERPYLTAFFQWRRDAGNTAYELEIGEALSAAGWSPSARSLPVVLSDIPIADGSLRRIKVKDTVPADQSAMRYMRIGAVEM